MSYSLIHPIILPGKHSITSLLVSSEHRRVMHARSTLLVASLNHRYYITGCHNIVRSITRTCINCCRSTAKPKLQLLGQIPVERITPDSLFNRVGLDYMYAGAFHFQVCFNPQTIIHQSICLLVCVIVYQGCSSGVGFRFIHRCLYCRNITVCSLQGKTLTDLEWPRHQFRRHCVRTLGINYFLPEPENLRCHLRVLCHAKHYLEIHSRTYSSLRGIMGSGSQSHEVTTEAVK